MVRLWYKLYNSHSHWCELGVIRSDTLHEFPHSNGFSTAHACWWLSRHTVHDPGVLGQLQAMWQWENYQLKCVFPNAPLGFPIWAESNPKETWADGSYLHGLSLLKNHWLTSVRVHKMNLPRIVAPLVQFELRSFWTDRVEEVHPRLSHVSVEFVPFGLGHDVVVDLEQRHPRFPCSRNSCSPITSEDCKKLRNSKNTGHNVQGVFDRKIHNSKCDFSHIFRLWHCDFKHHALQIIKRCFSLTS